MMPTWVRMRDDLLESRPGRRRTRKSSEISKSLLLPPRISNETNPARIFSKQMLTRESASLVFDFPTFRRVKENNCDYRDPLVYSF
ncbi:hypothetical protein YC2023_098662 [Brassica napus]